MAANRDEGGFAETIWMLMVSAITMTLILLVVDGWRVITIDRRLAAAVDSAAAAGANAVDEAYWASTGELRLDPDRAEDLAAANLDSQRGAEAMTDVVINATVDGVTVEARSTVRLLLVRIIGETGRTVYAAAEATPRRAA